jgi:hypothetical protein
MDLQNVRFVTRYYLVLQGLVLVPFGAMVVFLSIGQILGWSGFAQGDCTLPMALFPVAVGLTLLAFRYYRRRYGKVKLTTTLVSQIFSIVFVALCVPLVILSDYADFWFPQVAVSIHMLFMGGFCFAVPLASMGRRRHYWVMGGVVALFAILPAWELYPKTALAIGKGYSSLIYGLIMLVGGLFDHWTLVRSLPSASQSVAQESLP